MTWFPDWMKKAPETKPILAPRRFRVAVVQPLLTMPAHCIAIRDVWAYDEAQAVRMLSDEWDRIFTELEYYVEPLRLTWMTVDALMPNVVEAPRGR